MKFYIFLITMVLLIVGCKTQREAIGAADEIMVVVSEEDQGSISNALARVFTDTIYTPQPEAVYKLNYADPVGFNELKRQSNLIIGSIGTDESKTGTKLIKALLGDDLFNQTIHGDQQIIFSEDQFGRNQLFMVISGQSTKDIEQALTNKSEWIKSYYDKMFIDKQKKYLFGNDRLTNLSRDLKQKYGWELQIPWGWEVLRETPDSGFIWLGKELPYQWFSIHWEEGLVVEDSSRAVDYAFRFPQDYYNDIKYNDYRYQMEQVVFNDWTAWKSTGIWESIAGARGGPFVNYTWYDGITNRTYNLNMLVFIPSRSKSIFMRQMDIMAHSFSVN